MILLKSWCLFTMSRYDYKHLYLEFHSVAQGSWGFTVLAIICTFFIFVSLRERQWGGGILHVRWNFDISKTHWPGFLGWVLWAKPQVLPGFLGFIPKTRVECEHWSQHSSPFKGADCENFNHLGDNGKLYLSMNTRNLHHYPKDSVT